MSFRKEKPVIMTEPYDRHMFLTGLTKALQFFVPIVCGYN
jgi:hypothetical protein